MTSKQYRISQGSRSEVTCHLQKRQASMHILHRGLSTSTSGVFSGHSTLSVLRDFAVNLRSLVCQRWLAVGNSQHLAHKDQIWVPNAVGLREAGRSGAVIGRDAGESLAVAYDVEATTAAAAARGNT